MIIRAFEMEKDYDMVCRWWAKRGLPPVPKVILGIARGVIVSAGKQDVAAGWMYFDETLTIGVVDWITTNPAMALSPTLTDGINRILAFFEYAAKEKSVHNLFSFVAKDTGLHRQMVKTGWQDPQSEPHVYLFKSWPLPH